MKIRMIVGTTKEIKTGENRVGLTPHGINQLVLNGHKVLVERSAGVNSNFLDEEYQKSGATMVSSAKEIWDKCDMIVKVKEPLEAEFAFLREGLILFTYLHLAAEERLTKELLDRKVTSIAYETVELDDNFLPLLTPMSEVAGKMAVQVGAHYLEKTNGGSGKLLGGVPGVAPAKITVIGTGVVGMSAAKVASGMGAAVTIIGRSLNQLRYIDDVSQGRIKTLMSNPTNIEKSVVESDLVIGGVAITGYKAPKLVTREMVMKMKKGSVVIDVSIDQGGCIETARATSHQNPTYVEEGVIHYCVPNMPGAVPNTSTFALTNATFPYVLKIVNMGFEKAVKSDKALMKGVNTYQGKLTNKGVAEAFGMEYENMENLL